MWAADRYAPGWLTMPLFGVIPCQRPTSSIPPQPPSPRSTSPSNWGGTTWNLASTVAVAQKPRLKAIKARDLDALRDEIARAKARFGLPADARVVSCYEAGRDGFWLHRFLTHANIQQPRRRRRLASRSTAAPDAPSPTASTSRKLL